MGLLPFLSFTLVVARYDYEDEVYFKGAFLPNIHQLAEIIQSIVQVCSPLVPNPVVQNEETEPYSLDFMKVDENDESTRMISDEEYKRKAVGFLKKMTLHNKAYDARDMLFENVGQLKVENVKLLLSVAPKSGEPDADTFRRVSDFHRLELPISVFVIHSRTQEDRV